MSKFNTNFRCPCCNEPLSEEDISMYDIFEGMKEECYNEVQKTLQDISDQNIIDQEDLDTGE